MRENLTDKKGNFSLVRRITFLSPCTVAPTLKEGKIAYYQLARYIQTHICSRYIYSVYVYPDTAANSTVLLLLLKSTLSVLGSEEEEHILTFSEKNFFQMDS